MKHKKMILFFMALMLIFGIGKTNLTLAAETASPKPVYNYVEVNNLAPISELDTTMTYCNPTEIVISQKPNNEFPFQKSPYSQFYSTPKINVDFITDCSSDYGFNILRNSEYAEQLQALYLEMLEMMTTFYGNNEDCVESDFGGVTEYCIGSINYSQSPLTTQEIYSVFQCVIFDHPIFYCIKNQIYYDGAEVYLLTDEEFAKGDVRTSISLKIKEMVVSFDTGNYQSNYEIAQNVHDTIILNADYAYEQDGVTPQNNPFVHSIAGYVSDNKEMVCDGYAKTFASVMNYLDIDTIFVTGYSVPQDSAEYTDADAHAWNLVTLGNECYYFVDVTWDDLGEMGISDDFLCIGTELYQTHKIISTEIGVGDSYQYPIPDCAQEQFYGTDTLKIANDPAYTIIYEEDSELTGAPCGENVFWNLDSEGVLTISGKGPMWDFRNDSPIFDYHECPWESQKEQIKTVILGDGVTSVGADAFNSCHNLENVTFGKSILKLQAFAFYQCENLKDFILPQRLTYIGDQVFAGCEKITAVSIPDRVSFLGANIFTDAINLKSIYIGGSSDVGGYVVYMPILQNCTSLERIDVSPENFALYSEDGVLYSKDSRLLYQYPCGKKDKSYSILQETISIAEYAINYTQYLETITFPEQLVEIQHNAITFCPSLKSLVLPENVSILGYGIGNQCDNLEYIENHSETALYLNIDSYKEPLDGIWSYKYWMQAETGEFVDPVSNAKVIPRFFGSLRYEGDSFEIDGVTYSVIKSNLKDIFTPPSYTDLANNITNGTVCILANDANVEVPDIIQYEGWSYDVDKLHTHVGTLIPDAEPSCTITGNVAYYKCNCGKCFSDEACINEITEESTFLDYKHAGETAIKGYIAATCGEAGYTGDTYCKACGTKIADGTKTDNLTSHTWDAGVVIKEATTTETGEKTYTCSVCKKSKKEEIPELGVPKVGEQITSTDGATYIVSQTGSNDGSVTYMAPADKKATTVVIPATITIKNITYKVTKISDTTFAGNKNLTSVNIGDNVTGISAKTFKGCTNLKTLTIGNGVTSIPANAFKNFKKLVTVKIGTGVKSIGKQAFYGCKKVTSVTIGKNVTTIGSKAFYGCGKLKTLTIKSTKLTTKKSGNSAFGKTPKSMTVKIPKKKWGAYKSMLIQSGVNKNANFKKI